MSLFVVEMLKSESVEISCLLVISLSRIILRITFRLRSALSMWLIPSLISDDSLVLIKVHYIFKQL